jgi:hypothetical protein
VKQLTAKQRRGAYSYRSALRQHLVTQSADLLARALNICALVDACSK